MTDFYPKDYEFKETPSDYMKFGEEGDHQFRILAPVIIGFEFWWDESGERKVKRVKTFKEAVNDLKADKIKEFHAFIVWDYKTSMVRLLNISQKTLQKEIHGFVTDSDWGDPTKYDLVVTRKGMGFNDTEYSIRPKPAKPLSEEAEKAFKSIKVDIDQYFEGGHPIVREGGDNTKDIMDALDGK